MKTTSLHKIYAGCLLLMVMLLPFNLKGQDTLYWVGGSDSLWRHPLNWSTISGGSGGAVIPNSTTAIIFDSNAQRSCLLDTIGYAANILIDSSFVDTLYLTGQSGILYCANNFIMNGGTFISTDSSISINGSMIFNNGQFYDSSQYTIVADTFTVNGGYNNFLGWMVSLRGLINFNNGQGCNFYQNLFIYHDFNSNGPNVEFYIYGSSYVPGFSYLDATIYLEDTLILATPFVGNLIVDTNAYVTLGSDLMVWGDTHLEQNSTLYLGGVYGTDNPGSALSIGSTDTNSIVADSGAGVMVNDTLAFSNSAVFWYVINSAGMLQIPFISHDRKSVPVSYTIETPGGDTMVIVFYATYATNPYADPNNLPYPQQVEQIFGEMNFNSLYAADRYWACMTMRNTPGTNPVGKLTMHYSTDDIGGDNILQESNLVAFLYDGSQFNLLKGVVDTVGHSITLDSVANGFNFFFLYDSTALPLFDTLYWTGAQDSLWNNANNWSYPPGQVVPEKAPDSNATIYFNQYAIRPCYLDSTFTVNAMEVDSGAAVHLQGYSLTIKQDLTQNNGTLYGDSATLTINDSLILNGGSFISPANLNLYHDFTDTLNIFHSNNGTITFNDSAFVITKDTLYNLVIADTNVVILKKNLKVSHQINLNNSVLVLGGHHLDILNASSSAISANTGGILEETPNFYSKVNWFVGTQTGTYIVPLLTATEENISLEMDVLTGGTDSTTGYLSVSTYPTNNFKEPMPTSISDYYLFTLQRIQNPQNIVNRFWQINANNYTGSPLVNVKLKYPASGIVSGDSIIQDSIAPYKWVDTAWIKVNTFSIDTVNHISTADSIGYGIYVASSATISKYTLGNSCQTAINIDSLLPNTVINMRDTNMWFVYTALDTGSMIIFSQDTHKIFDFNMVDEYDAPCGSGYNINEVLNSNKGSGVLPVVTNSLTTGSQYYLKLSQSVGDSSWFMINDITDMTPEQFLTSSIFDSLNYYEVVKIYDKYYQMNPPTAPIDEDGDFINYLRWKDFWRSRVDQRGYFSAFGLALAQEVAAQGNTCLTPNDTCIYSGPSWTCLGPFATEPAGGQQDVGRVVGIGVNPSNSNEIILSSSAGGLFKTTNAGSTNPTWTNITNNSGYSLYGFTNIIFHPADNNTIYTGGVSLNLGIWSLRNNAGYSPGIISSSDGGNTWQTSGLDLCPLTQFKSVVQLLMDPTSTSVATTKMYALVATSAEQLLGPYNASIMKCDGDPNLPDSWTQLSFNPPSTVYNPPKNFYSIALDPNNPNYLWAAVPTGNSITAGLYLSSDGGSSFTVTNGFLTTTNAILKPTCLTASDITSLSMSIAADDEIFIVVGYSSSCLSGHFLYSSSDFGNSWTLISTSSMNDGFTDIAACIVSPNNTNVLYAGGCTSNQGLCQGKAWKSTNSGTSWTEIGSGLHVDLRAMQIARPGSGTGNTTGEQDVVMFGTDGGISMTNGTDGNIRDLCGTGLSIAQIFGFGSSEEDGDYIFTGSQDNSVNHYNDGVWSYDGIGGDNGDCIVNPDNKSIVYQESNDILQYSDNYGTDDISIYISNQGQLSVAFPMAMDPTNPNNIYAGYNYIAYVDGSWVPVPSLYKNSDGGAGSWITLASDPSWGNAINDVEVMPQDPTIVYQDPNIVTYFALDGNYAGDTYGPYNSDLDQTWAGLYKVEENLSEGTTTLTQINGNLHGTGCTLYPNAPLFQESISTVAVEPGNPNRIWVGFNGYYTNDGTVCKVYHSEDGGSTWTNMSTCLPNLPVNKLLYQEGSNDCLFAATDMGVFFRDATMSNWEYYGNLPNSQVLDMEINYCSGKLRAATFGNGLWETSIATGGNSTNPLTITGNTVWSTEVHMKRDLVIAPGARLTVTNTLGMPENGLITVQQGGELILNGGTITNMCGDLWNGVEVWGTQSEPQPSLGDILGSGDGVDASYPSSDGSSPQGVVIIENEATISNAKNGIMALHGVTPTWADPSYNGGIIYANNSSFINNVRSIGLNIYPADYNTSGWNSISQIENCTFETTQYPLNEGTSLDRHIALWDVHGVEIENNTFDNEAQTNSINDGDGIRTIDADFKAYENTFTNLYNGINIPSTGAEPNLNTDIQSNTFTGNMRGINASGTSYLKILENTIDINNNVSGIGIDNQGNEYFRIEENTITLPNQVNYLPASGIYSVATGGTTNTIYKNTVNSVTADPSYWFYGMAMSGGSPGNNGLTLQCNTFDGNMDNIALLSLGIMNPQGNCNADGNGGADNTLSESCNNYGNDYQLFTSGINTLPFVYYNDPGYDVSKYCVYPTNQVATDCGVVYSGSGSACASHILGPISRASLQAEIANTNLPLTNEYALLDNGNTSNDRQMINNPGVPDSVIFDTLQSINGMVSDDLLLQLMNRTHLVEYNDGYVTTGVDAAKLAALLIQNAPLSNPIMTEIPRLLSPLPADSLTKIYLYQDSSSARELIIDSIYQLKHIKGLDYTLLAGYTVTDSTYSLNMLIDSMQEETDPYLQLMLVDLYMANDQYDSAQSLLDSVIVISSEMKNYRALKNIDLTFKRNGWNWMNMAGGSDSSAASVYKDSLSIIANADTSIAAYQAQGILKLVFGDTILQVMELGYNMEDKWGGPKNPTTTGIVIPPSPTSRILKVYPNPAGNQLTVEYNFNDSATFNNEFVLYDILGDPVFSQSLSGNSGKADLDISSIPNGFYTYGIKRENTIMKSGKLSIIK